ncbi:MAG: multiheme c-type cytochrome [Myxococcota bacterium]
MNRALTLVLLLATAALAEPGDPRGWTPGEVASGAARVLAGPDTAELPELEFPKEFQKSLGKGRTLIFYFSPTCPHCQAVGAELGDLGRAIGDRATVIAVATGSSLKGDVMDFKAKYRIDADFVMDTDRGIQTAMGVRSTPSMLLVEPGSKGKHKIVDVWYPYQPGFDTYVRMRVEENPWAAFDGTYLGNGSCAGCHQQELEGWALTHHSIAWRTLVLKGDDKNPECTGCHVTGNGQASGWTPDSDGELVNVGCEACHGPSGPHDGTRTDPNTTCAGCHDAKHSIQFSLAKGVPLIDHFAANALSDDDFTKRRMALVDGEAPRSLLAFADDATVGAEACKSCHEAEYTQWKGTGHASAMQILLKEEKDGDASCVKCHATGKRGGPPSPDLDGFRMQESVGCEACHGPGEAHVKAGGGTDNIEKLGDDCPVCVIEAVCTSCHTPTWDKDWDLDTHLPKAGHTPSE